MPQLLGQLLDQEKAARETAIDERAMVTLDPSRPEEAHQPRVAGRKRGERIGER